MTARGASTSASLVTASALPSRIPSSAPLVWRSEPAIVGCMPLSAPNTANSGAGSPSRVAAPHASPLATADFNTRVPGQPARNICFPRRAAAWRYAGQVRLIVAQSGTLPVISSAARRRTIAPRRRLALSSRPRTSAASRGVREADHSAANKRAIPVDRRMHLAFGRERARQREPTAYSGALLLQADARHTSCSDGPRGTWTAGPVPRREHGRQGAVDRARASGRPDRRDRPLYWRAAGCGVVDGIRRPAQRLEHRGGGHRGAHAVPRADDRAGGRRRQAGLLREASFARARAHRAGDRGDAQRRRQAPDRLPP